MDCFFAGVVPLLLYASVSQAAPMATSSTEGQTPPSSSENMQEVVPDHSSSPQIIPSVPQSAPMAKTDIEGQIPPSSSKNMQEVVPDPPSQPIVPPGPQVTVTAQSSPPVTSPPIQAQKPSQLKQCPPSSVQCPPGSVQCPPDAPQCPPCPSDKSEKPPKPEEKLNWRTGLKTIFKACYKAALKLCATLVTTTGQEYTEQRKQQKKPHRSFVCCLTIKNQPPPSSKDQENCGEKNLQAGATIPPISLSWVNGRTTATISTVPGAPAPAPGSTPIAPGAKSNQVNTNCCCVGEDMCNFTGCFNFKIKNQINVCSCTANASVVDN